MRSIVIRCCFVLKRGRPTRSTRYACQRNASCRWNRTDNLSNHDVQTEEQHTSDPGDLGDVLHDEAHLALQNDSSNQGIRNDSTPELIAQELHNIALLNPADHYSIDDAVNLSASNNQIDQSIRSHSIPFVIQDVDSFQSIDQADSYVELLRAELHAAELKLIQRTTQMDDQSDEQEDNDVNESSNNPSSDHVLLGDNFSVDNPGLEINHAQLTSDAAVAMQVISAPNQQVRCEFECREVEMMSSHRREHGDIVDMNYQCSLCSFNMRTIAFAETHIKRCHSNGCPTSVFVIQMCIVHVF